MTMVATSTVEEVLADLERRHGDVDPRVLVTEASSESHPLHDRFEWDDARASESWRLEQASAIIRSVRVRVVSSDEDLSVRKYYAGRDTGISDPGTYRDIDAVREDPKALAQLERSMERDLAALERRYRHFCQWENVVSKAAKRAKA